MSNTGDATNIVQLECANGPCRGRRILVKAFVTRVALPLRLSNGRFVNAMYARCGLGDELWLDAAAYAESLLRPHTKAIRLALWRGLTRPSTKT